MYSGADEQRFLEASMAYVSGKPIMSDEEFDNLKQKLKVLDACYFLLSFCYCLFWHYYLFLPLFLLVLPSLLLISLALHLVE